MENNNDLKTKLMRLEEDLLPSDVTTKAMALQVTHLEDEKTKLMDEKESIIIEKQEIIALPMNRLRPKCSARATKKLSETIPEQYFGLALQNDPCSVHGV